MNVPVAAAPGNYSGTTSGVSAKESGISTVSTAAEDTLKISGLVFSKEFIGSPYIAGETGTLRFTIQNVHPTTEATITSFTDNLQDILAGFSATGVPTQDSCGGTLSGTTFLIYQGGTVQRGTTGMIDVPIKIPVNATDGSYPSSTGRLVVDQGGTVNIDPAAAVLEVNSTRLQLEMDFTDDPVVAGASATLGLTLTNLDAVRSVSGIDFSVDLDAALSGLTFDSVLLDETNGTLSGNGSGIIHVSGASLAAGASASLRIFITVPAGAGEGVYSCVSSIVSGTIDDLAVTGAAASDDLNVFQQVQFSKSFDGPSAATGSATLTYTITNPRSDAVSGLRFTDDLGSVIPGLVATNLPAKPCGEDSTITGSSFLIFSGGELSPGGSCSFSVDVLVPGTAVAGTFASTSGDLLSSGLSVASPATANLTIEPPPVFSKAFSSNSVAYGEIVTLIFTIDNSASALAATNLDFADNLPAGLQVASPANATSMCGGTVTAVPGSGTISFSGGTIAAGVLGAVQVDVMATGVGTFVNASGNLTSSSGNSGSASDALTVNKANQTIDFPMIGSQTVLDTFGLSASASSSGTVTFAASAPGVISNGTNLSFTASGSVAVIASQAGDANWNPALPVTNTFDVVGVVTNVSPNLGTVYGGTEVVIDGLWLGDGSNISSVSLCGVEASIVSQEMHRVTVLSGITNSPVAITGAVEVVSGYGTATLADGFIYNPVPEAPVARSAVDITASQFTARWETTANTTHYFLDVSETTNFTDMVGVYSNWNAGASTAGLVTGLVDGVTYWYRVRAANEYGSGPDSNIIEVPVSDNTPFVQMDITNGVVSAGSLDTVVLTELFHGSGMTYSIVTNTNPSAVSATIVGAELLLDYLSVGTADITVRVTDANGFSVDTTLRITVVPVPGTSFGAVIFNSQNGLFEQVITVTNGSAFAADTVTLTVTALTAGAELYNATGTDRNGNREIQWNGTLAAGASMPFTLQYYNPAGTVPTATVEVSLSLKDVKTAVVGRAFNLIGLPRTLNGSSAFLIEFEAVPGRTYYIQYQDILGGDWKTVYPAITAPVNKVQWIDSGPPATESMPSSRFYQVIEIAE